MKDNLKQKFINKNKPLFWDEKDLKNISNSLLVERILNYGDFEDVKTLINILGMEEVNHIFQEKIEQERHNFSPKTVNYFKLFFKRNLS